MWRRAAHANTRRKQGQYVPPVDDMPIYYVGCGASQTVAELSSALDLINGLDELPWPEEQCILLWEPFIHGAVPAIGARWSGLYGIVRDAGYGEQAAHIQSFAGLFDGVLKMDDEPAMILQKLDKDMQRPCWDKYNMADAYRWLPVEEQRIVEEFHTMQDHTVGKNGTWLAGSLVNKRDGGVSVGELYYPIDLLHCLSMLAAPCHYMVVSRFAEGFGTKAQRRWTKEKPIFVSVPYDRLYKLIEDQQERQPVQPHFRRGHIRHMWKESGINRFALPDNPAERFQLVKRHHVRRIYIHPTWVGDPLILDGDVTHEVQQGETELN
jgi:hypothetical protein